MEPVTFPNPQFKPGDVLVCVDGYMFVEGGEYTVSDAGLLYCRYDDAYGNDADGLYTSTSSTFVLKTPAEEPAPVLDTEPQFFPHAWFKPGDVLVCAWDGGEFRRGAEYRVSPQGRLTGMLGGVYGPGWPGRTLSAFVLKTPAEEPAPRPAPAPAPVPDMAPRTFPDKMFQPGDTLECAWGTGGAFTTGAEYVVSLGGLLEGRSKSTFGEAVGGMCRTVSTFTLKHRYAGTPVDTARPDGHAGRTSGYPDDNPKTAVGLSKPSLSSIPPVALFQIGRAMKDGREKYGPMNWRKDAVTATTYYDAAERHMMAWFDGEECADDSGVHHLAHAAACLCIIMDAASVGKLNDDRPLPGKLAEFLKEHTASS